MRPTDLTLIWSDLVKFSGFAKLTRDLTERNKIEAILTNATAAAEKANLAKSEFLSSMSHAR